VNNGTSRPVTLSGLPASVTQMSFYVTDEKRGMEKLEPVSVRNGSARFTLPGQTLTTLINLENAVRLNHEIHELHEPKA
jgi:hypothetical protein